MADPLTPEQQWRFTAASEELDGKPCAVRPLLDEIDRLRDAVDGLLDQNQAIAENVARMMPVYSAAIAWRRADKADTIDGPIDGAHPQLDALRRAVDATDLGEGHDYEPEGGR